MKLFAFAMLARKSERLFERLEPIPVVVAALSEREATEKAREAAGKMYSPNDGWSLVGNMVEIDPTSLLELIAAASDSKQAQVFPAVILDYQAR